MRERFRRRSTSESTNWLDLPDFDIDLGGFAAAIVIVAVIVLLLLFGWPVLLIGIDLIWLLLVGLLGVVGRVVLRRPWRVEAVSASQRRQWYVQGYRAAGRRRDEIANQFTHGHNPTGDDAIAVQQ